MSRFSARHLRTLTRPGLYSDGGNLYLQVRGPTQRSWLFRYMIDGKARSMGLGHVNEVSLAEARNKADAARKLLREGIDPREQRDAMHTAAVAAKARAHTFCDAVRHYIAAQEVGWHNAIHRHNWRASLATYVEPVIGTLPVEAIDTDLVLKVPESIWRTKTETASRIRGRIEMVLSYAIARGWREGPNPAVWCGHLQLMLPRRTKVLPVEHHPALDWREAPPFMGKLREQDSIGARALQFAILTATRSGEGAFCYLGRNRHGARDVDNPRLAHEGRQRTPSAAVEPGARRAAIGVAAAHRHGALIPRPAAKAPTHNGDVVAPTSPHGAGGHHSARLPFDVPRLGGRSHELPQPRCRAGVGAHHRQSSGGGLPVQ
jgi:hypothetical protein